MQRNIKSRFAQLRASKMPQYLAKTILQRPSCEDCEGHWRSPHHFKGGLTSLIQTISIQCTLPPNFLLLHCANECKCGPIQGSGTSLLLRPYPVSPARQSASLSNLSLRSWIQHNRHVTNFHPQRSPVRIRRGQPLVTRYGHIVIGKLHGCIGSRLHLQNQFAVVVR